MFKLSLTLAILIIGGYLLQRNFRRMFYVLWTGEEKPDWKTLEAKWWGPKEKEPHQ